MNILSSEISSVDNPYAEGTLSIESTSAHSIFSIILFPSVLFSMATDRITFIRLILLLHKSNDFDVK